jgi:cation diffusion facilitator CzcD-associated flavoprotein CzcO
MGMRRTRAGQHSFVILESSGAVGGTWRDNTYPGASRDGPDPGPVAGHGVGPAQPPTFRDIPGREEFRGDSWHSARWNDVVDLAGQRVACIGNGAGAVQFIPEIAPVVERLTVFQRHANYVVPRLDRPYEPAERTEFLEGPDTLQASRDAIHREHEGWMGAMKQGTRWPPSSPPPRDDVELVTEKIEGVEADGVRTSDGVLHQVDVIIYATGFETLSFNAAMPIIGRDGSTLAEAWRDGPEAYLGMTVSGFPTSACSTARTPTSGTTRPSPCWRGS